MLNIIPPYHSLQELNLDWILTKVKNILRFVPDDGAVGQILRRTAHGAEWSDEQGGGGGGAVDSVNGKTGVVVLDKTDIGLGNVDNVQQYSASNPPPYPVTSVNGQTGAVTVTAPVTSVNGQTGAVSISVPDSTSDLVNDSGFVDAAGAAAAAPVQSVNGQTGAVTVATPTQSTTSPTIVKTSGNSSVNAASVTRYGNVCYISIQFVNGPDTTAGNNSFIGNMTSGPLPATNAELIGFYGSHVFMCDFDTSGNIKVRVTQSGGYWASTDLHSVRGAYICNP